MIKAGCLGSLPAGGESGHLDSLEGKWGLQGYTRGSSGEPRCLGSPSFSGKKVGLSRFDWRGVLGARPLTPTWKRPFWKAPTLNFATPSFSVRSCSLATSTPTTSASAASQEKGSRGWG